MITTKQHDAATQQRVIRIVNGEKRGDHMSVMIEDFSRVSPLSSQESFAIAVCVGDEKHPVTLMPIELMEPGTFS